MCRKVVLRIGPIWRCGYQNKFANASHGLDEALAAKLWNLTEEITGIHFPYFIIKFYVVNLRRYVSFANKKMPPADLQMANRWQLLKFFRAIRSHPHNYRAPVQQERPA